MNVQRLRSLIDRRVRYRVTRGGVLFTLALLLTGAGAFVSGNNLLFLVFSAMLALLLVSGFLSRLVLSGLELELLLPEHVCARTASPARIRIRNIKRLTPSFSIELSGVRGEPSILIHAVYFPLIPGRAVIEAPVQVTFPRRGRHRENLFVLLTKFPFGFLRNTTTVALRRETIVYPSLQPQSDMELMLADISGEMESRDRGTGLDFYRIRPYEFTDSARLVDWKSTAHTGVLQVREFSRDQQKAVEIFLDRSVFVGGHDWFERAVERCAFLVWSLADREIEFRMRSQRYSFGVPEDGEVYGVLRYLALVEAITGTLAEDSDVPESGSGIRIVFSQRPESFESAGWTNASG